MCPNTSNAKVNSPLIDTSIPTPEKEEKEREEEGNELDHITDYYPQVQYTL